MERIPGSERTREKLKALMEGRSEAEDGRPQLVRLAAQRVLPYDEMYAQRMYARIPSVGLHAIAQFPRLPGRVAGSSVSA